MINKAIFLTVTILYSVNILQGKLEYGKDFILFPSQDGSQHLIPAFLNEDLTKDVTVKFVATVKDIHFYLYTARNPKLPQELFVGDYKTLESSNFLENVELKILCHGFAGSFLNPFPATLKNKYIDTYKSMAFGVNVIVIDWSLLAIAPFYITAVHNLPIVGEEVARMIQFLIHANYITLDKIHFIGHSLGAHIGGITGTLVLSTNGELARVTGLDPAAPLIVNTTKSINSTVARFVDIIHTDGEFLGIPYPVGTVDFFPNGGLKQRGCIDFFGICAHLRAYEYFRESIIAPSNKVLFKSCYCTHCKIRDSWCYNDKFLQGKCDCNRVVSMGDRAQFGAHGTYFLNTNSDSPFSQS